MKINQIMLCILVFSVFNFQKPLQANVLSVQGLRADHGDSSEFKKEPTPLDWKNFFLLSTLSRSTLWKKIEGQGYSLQDWHWQWRLAWIKSCQKESINYCNQILENALKDRAAVVRAAAATQLGRIYEKTNDLRVVEKLKLAYLYKDRQRQQADFVKKRIIFALTRILDEPQNFNKKFLKDKMGVAYWHKIQSSKQKNSSASF